MASWDDVKSRISWAGKASVVKTRTLAKLAAVNGKISDAEKSLKDEYLALGRKFVEDEYAGISVEDIEERLERAAVEDSSEAGLLEAVLKVKRNEALLDELFEEKEELKGITPCRVCGMEVTADSRFCSKCGAMVNPGVPDEPDASDDGETPDDPDIPDEEEAPEETEDDGTEDDRELPHPIEIEVGKDDEAAEEVVNDVAGDMAADVRRYMEDGGEAAEE